MCTRIRLKLLKDSSEEKCACINLKKVELIRCSRDVREVTQNVKILIYISGLIGVSLTAFFMMAFRGPSSLRLESWEIWIFADALASLSASFVLGALALIFQSETKSPYLMGASTVTSAIGFVFAYSRFVRLQITNQAGLFLSLAFITTVSLMVSAVFSAYTHKTVQKLNYRISARFKGRPRNQK